MIAKIAGLITIVALVVGAFPSVSAPPAAPSAPAALSISVVPAVLPADNITYPALVVSLVDAMGTPTIATNNTLVFLTSSLESVGKVQPTVTIGIGRNYALANFTTTKTSGKTKITASSNGLQSNSLSVSTLVARGYPTQLIIVAVPNIVIAKRNNIGSLIMELQDDAGLPAKAVSDTIVNLYSSNKHVLNISEASTTIPAGQFLRQVNYTTGFVPGAAFITASASGFGPGSTSVTVLGLPPLALKLYAQPTSMAACVQALQAIPGGCLGRLVIAVTDSQGNPVPAPRDITVFIRSSDLTVITIPRDQVKIQAGNISATATYQTTSKVSPGKPTALQAQIAVSSPSLQSDFAKVTTIAPSTTLTPGQSGIKLFVGPAVVLANHQSYSSVVVSLVNGSIPSVNSTGPTKVVLTSSLSAVGNITQVLLTIPAWHTFASTVFTSTFRVGETVLTASGHNLIPDQNKLTTFGPIPSKIVLKSISSALPADGSTHNALEIALEDSFGSPAFAPSYLPVNLTSSQNGIARVSSVGIKPGQSYAIANVTTGVVPGTANLTAVASTAQLPASKLSSGYIVSSTQVSTVIPAPSTLAAYVATQKGLLDKASSPFLVIQLQDAASNPARARQATSVTITPSNTTVFDKTLRMTIPTGGDFVKVPIQAKAIGSTTFTLSSPGLESASATMTFLARPYRVQISPTEQSMFANQTLSITAAAQILGKGVKGVQVKWNTSSGLLSSTNSTTGATGTATVVFTPGGQGVAKITAVLSHPALGVANLTSTIIVVAAPIKVQPSIVQVLLSYPYLYGVIGGTVGVVIALLVVFIRRRRKKGEVGEDAGFDLAVSAFSLIIGRPLV